MPYHLTATARIMWSLPPVRVAALIVVALAPFVVVLAPDARADAHRSGWAQVLLHPGEWTVRDGDSLSLPGAALRIAHNTVPLAKPLGARLLGGDAPELYSARCPEERQLATAARDRLAELLASGRVTLWTRGELDRYGRLLVHADAAGVDAMATLLEEGHARPYDGRSPRTSWCPATSTSP